jgi:hypothetical protein
MACALLFGSASSERRPILDECRGRLQRLSRVGTQEEAAVDLTLWILAGCGLAMLLTGLARRAPRRRQNRQNRSDTDRRFTADEVDRLLARLQTRRDKSAGLSAAAARGSASRAL